MNRHPAMRGLNESDLREYAEENLNVIPAQFNACKETMSLMDMNRDDKVSEQEFLYVCRIAVDGKTSSDINNIFKRIAGNNGSEFELADLLSQIRIEGIQQVVSAITNKDSQKKINEFREWIMRVNQRESRESQTKEVNSLKDQVKMLANKNRELEEQGLEFGKYLEEAINNNEITQNKLNEKSEECRKYMQNIELRNASDLNRDNHQGNNETKNLKTDPSSAQIIRELEQDVSKLSQDNSILKKMFEREEREKKDLEKQITTINMIVQDKKIHINEESVQLKRKIDELIEESRVHQNFIEELNQECSAKIDYQIHEEVLKEKKAIITKCNVLEEEIEKTQEEKRRISDKLHKTIEDLDTQNIKLSNENTEVLETIKQNNKKNREEFENLKHAFEEEEARLCNEKDEVSQTIQENSKKHKEEVEKLKLELENVYADLQELKNKNFQADECNTNLNMTVEELHRNIVHLQEEKLVIEKTLMNKNDEVQKLMTEKQELETKEALNSQKLEEEEDEREFNNKALLEEELYSLRREYNDMMSNKDRDGDILNKVVQGLKEEIDQLRTMLETAQNELELVSVEVMAARNKDENNNELALKLEDLTINNEKLYQELKNKNEQLTKMELIQEENEQLKKIVEDFEEKNSRYTLKETSNIHEQVQPSLAIESQKDENGLKPIEKIDGDAQDQLEVTCLDDSELKNVISQLVKNETIPEDDISITQLRHAELENDFLDLMVEFVIVKASEEIYFENTNKIINKAEDVNLKRESSTQSESEDRESVQELEELKSTVQTLVTEKQVLSSQNKILESRIESLEIKIESRNDGFKLTLAEMVSKFSQLIE